MPRPHRSALQQREPLTTLSDVAPGDVEEVVVAWQMPLRRAGVARTPDDPLPFTLVNHIAGTENVDEGTADPVVSVHTLCDRTLGFGVAALECSHTHSRMLRLARHLDDITLTGGAVVSIDYLIVVESPIWQPYEDNQIIRKVGRYQIGLCYTPQT